MILVQQTEHKKMNQDDSLIPLINIVFLMLIFFMVAGHIEVSDAIKVIPPVSKSEVERQQNPLNITVSSDQRISVNNQETLLPMLTEVVNKHFTESEDNETFSILLKVDADLAVESLQPILYAIKQTGIKKVALATQMMATTDD